MFSLVAFEPRSVTLPRSVIQTEICYICYTKFLLFCVCVAADHVQLQCILLLYKQIIYVITSTVKMIYIPAFHD